MSTFQKPTDSELEILRILWENGPSTVRFVNEKLNEQKETGYTTTLKLMQIMLDKSLVFRDDENRTHIYQAKIKQEDTQKLLLDKLVSTVFEGSAAKLVMQALGRKKTTAGELEEIKKLIEKIEGGAK